MKKRVINLLAVLLMISMFPFAAFADEMPAFSVTSAEAKPGDEVEITVSCSDNPGITAWKLDINFLKKVNDEYGHAEGDRHIINASHIIRESFENIGESFRTGGDEFIVITKSCDEREVEKSVSKMEKSVLSYNKKE